MFRLSKLVSHLSHVKRSNMFICCCKNFLPGIINNCQEQPIYLRTLQHSTFSYKNHRILNILDWHRGNSSVDMSSSVSEEFRHLDYNQMIELQGKPSNIVIDVREKKELDDTGVIPGAYHIPLGDIEVAFNTPKDEFKNKYSFEKPTTEDSVIFSCRSGKRSLIALEKALASGFKNAKHYKGGWLDWEKHLSESKN